MSVEIHSSGALVSSGDVITSAVLAEGGNDSMWVLNGGTANSTTVNSSGNLRVSSGGIANYATVNDAGDLDVLIGGIASNIIINGGSVSVYNSGSAVSAQVHSGKLCIFSGGHATYTTVDKSGILTFGNPGTANYTTVNSGGSMYMKSGGIANSTTVNSSGEMYVSSGGTANNTTVNSSGRMYVRNGGIANDNMINSFGKQVISSGGITNSTTVTSSGYVWVLGGIANSTIVSFYGSMFVDDGIANDTIVNSSGKLYVRSNGVASDTTVNSSGLMRVSSGGTVNNTTVNSWGSMYVFSGGTATNIIASTWAYLGFIVAPDTYIQGTSNGSAFEIKDGKVDNYIINRGYLHISNGGVASNTTVHNGNLYIDNGGVASDTIMNYGSMYVSKGATANSITYSSGSLYIYGSANNIITDSGMFMGEIIISDGGVVDYFTVNGRGNSYKSFRIESGGVANSITINSMGRLDNCGQVNDVAINGGTLYVSKGIANDVVFYGGALTTAEGVVINNLSINGSLQNTSINHISVQGIVNNLVVNGPVYYNVNIHTVNSGIINSGADLSYSGDIINDMIVNSGGKLHIFDHTNSVNNLTIKQGGRINGFSFNSDVIIESGVHISNAIVDAYYDEDGGCYYGNAFLRNGQTVNNVIIAKGDLIIYSGGTATNIDWTPCEGGHVTVETGATATFTSEYSGVYLGMDEQLVSHTQIMNNKTVFDKMYIFNEGVANNTTINSYCLLFVYNGGIANNTTVNSFGYLSVSSGGMANSTTVNSGGSMYVSSGGTANNTTVNSGGSMYVSSGGTASNTTIKQGGTINRFTLQEDNFYESGVHISNAIVEGGAYLYSGQTANNTTVNSDGVLMVYDGGTANNTIVQELGYLYVSSGGIVNNTTVNSSGVMVVYGGGIIGGTLRTETGAVVSAYEGSIIDFTVADRTAEDDYLINDLSLIQGSPTYTITVHSSQSIGTYKLAQGAENFTGTLSIGTETENYGTITVNGDILVRNDLSYKLVQDNGDLTLGIYRFADISRVTANTVYPTQKLYLFATFNEHSAQKLYSYDQKTWFEYDKNVLVEDNVTVYFKALNGNGVESEIKSYTVTNIDKTPPTLTISGNPTEWTNQGITLDVRAEDANGIARIEYSEDSGATWKTWSSRYLESGNFLFRAVDTVGNISEVSEVVVDKIDTIQPTLKGLKGLPTAWTNQDTTVEFVVDDSISGIAKIEYAFNNSNEFIEGSSFILSRPYSSVTVRVTDNAGNVTEQNFSNAELRYVEKIAPQITINHNPDLETWRNGAVLLTIFVTDDGGSSIKEEKYHFDYEPEDTWHRIGSQITVTQNCTVYFYAVDNAGNITEKEFVVSCLDNNAPTYTVTQSTNKPTYDPVTITISADDDLSGIKSVEYSFNQSEWFEGNSFTMDRNGSYWVRVTDNAGNVSMVRQYFVDNIVGVLDLPIVTANTVAPTNKNVVLTAEFDSNSTQNSYRINNGAWQKYLGSITINSNATVTFCSINEYGKEFTTVYVVDNIDRKDPETPIVSADKTVITNKPVLVTAVFSSDSVVKEYSFDQKTWFAYADGVTMLENGSVYFRSQDAAGNISNIAEYKVDNIFIRTDIIDLDKNNEDSVVIEFSNDKFTNSTAIEVSGNAIEVYAPSANWQYKVENSSTTYKVDTIKQLQAIDYFEATENGVADIFLARTNGVWGSLMRAEYQGSADVEAEVVLKGKNKLCDIFVGSSDSNILFLTNDSNGDALFIDDIYSASFDNLGESNSRLAQIKEIQAGDGDDIIDLTSNKFDYSGSEMTIYGGSGNDIIWANDSVDNVIHGGLGDDTLVGGSQANTFVFEANWGNDVIYCNGTVTLNFIGVKEGDLTFTDNTISDGDNTITLINFENSDYSITYSQLA